MQGTVQALLELRYLSKEVEQIKKKPEDSSQVRGMHRTGDTFCLPPSKQRKRSLRQSLSQLYIFPPDPEKLVGNS